MVLVTGYSRVPEPPAKMIPFIAFTLHINYNPDLLSTTLPSVKTYNFTFRFRSSSGCIGTSSALTEKSVYCLVRFGL